MKNDEIMVSICCLTYNQEQYIRDALEGFLQQKTNFNYEIIVHDDASTDNTSKILKEYERKYPNKIVAMYEENNSYPRINKVILSLFKQAKGKYITICEGDDYWVDENKLQMQVEYMEEHLNCTLSFHNAKIIDMKTHKEEIFIPYTKEAKRNLKKDGNYNVGQLEMIGFIPTASYMLRSEDVKKLPDWFEKCFVGDWPLKLILTSFGYAHYIDRNMSVYRRNAKGSMTVKNVTREGESLSGKKEILGKKEEFVRNIDEFTDYKYHWAFERRLLQYETEMLFYIGNGKEIIKKKYIKYILPEKRVKWLIKIYFPKTIKIIKKIIKKIINKEKKTI